ncbi:sugar-proton symporter [Ameyamaea chiangmaiensis NBRC 103196]|uniref:Sugar porter family MFS transporter n=1 Tax=Ameyamaea chiangmaiensis TaxID=442969 RepID=A0A850PEE5_9PROT|nr:sugar porter family MFS transporter [Ameyamaea chiangmaiensis]MBS4074399.1 sugar porter family MFS transporter [Ameyamaea chiangmaiensis]NVN41059.1 sugar porter family MFS transporter [Ameyamaea chiangmaiensis]GBQ71900.1 sugar-proton symporter [Ameyamaea chiangmaiensis NBRC 103196]
MSEAVFSTHPDAVPRTAKGVLTAVLAAVAGLMFGLDIGVISGALSFIAKDFGASQAAQEWIVSSMMFGAAIGALFAGRLSFSFGRKKSLVLGACLFVVGSLLCAVATSVAMLIGARVVLGLAIGIATFTAPLYISEVSDHARRGSLISTYQLMITIGILVAFVSDALFSYYEAWRWMLGVVAFPGLVFLVGVMFLPDSPRWLIMRGRHEEAHKVLTSLRGDERLAHLETRDIVEQLQERQQGFTLFRNNPNFRRSVFLGIALQVVQQFTGMNVVMYYAPRIFEATGFGQGAQMWGTAIVGLVNVLSTFIAIGYVDKWGRRPMLLAGFVVMALGMGVLGTMLYIGTGTDMARYLSVAVLLCFIIGFAFSAGPLIWILCSEVQPLQGRDFGIACSTFTNWGANMVVGATFLTLLSTLGTAQTFWLYAALNALFIVFTLRFVPETRGVSLEQIERNLMAGKPLNEIGQPV